MNILSKEALEGLIHDLKETGKTTRYNCETKEKRVEYSKPRGYLTERMGRVRDVAPDIMAYFLSILNNYERYKVDEKFQKKVYKNLEKLHIAYYKSFKQLKGYIVEDEKFIQKLLKKAPANIFLLDNPSKELIDKAFKMSNNIVLYDFTGEKALYSKESKIKAIKRYPGGYTAEVNTRTDPLLEVEAYKTDYLVSFKNEEKLYENIDVLKTFEADEDKSGMIDVYDSLPRGIKPSAYFSKEALLKLLGKASNNDAPKFLMNLSQDEYDDIMTYIICREICIVERFDSLRRWGCVLTVF